MKWLLLIFAVGFATVLVAGTVQKPDFWRTPDRRGDTLFGVRKFAEAAKTYTDPARIGVAQYRNADFEAATRTFARVPGAIGAFNEGNALVMLGKYDAAIQSYDRALGFRAGWKEAEENKSIAMIRKKRLDDSSKNREIESAEAYKPDQIAFDMKGKNEKAQPMEMSQETMSDAELRATWLRQVQTTPGDFLRAKFAYQASQEDMK
jgi:Ca-activated chloride channel family protein